MDEKAVFDLLDDKELLLEAHAASSPYVMRRAFELARPMREFSGHVEFGGELHRRIARMAGEPAVDPVTLAAHVYALELTGATDELRSAAKSVLGQEALRDDEMVGQFVGYTAQRLMHPRKQISQAKHLEKQELEQLAEAL